ncbi:uncharacterized protein LOC113765457 isoform X1 [Coffea eugenioides]|uniref:uncharacterized protein LOC113765457 isoform X1 n=1 Tax=Coffea eugenioides TaxID=49369 RepID=UPI000F60D57F|nr:uncharacterized protein LOC113765457 isoform X1 [Coffea eugenioides]
MKILQEYAGALTNFEVLDFLRSRGAGKDPTRLIAGIAPSEYKVYDYLEQTAASTQTRDIAIEFVQKCKEYNLAKAEILNILNIRPSCEAALYPIIEDWDIRFSVEEEKEEEELGLLKTICQVLPPPPSVMESDEGIGVEEEDNPDEQQKKAVE